MQWLLNVGKCRKRDIKSIKTVYQGIGIRALPELNIKTNSDFDQLTDFTVPPGTIQNQTT